MGLGLEEEERREEMCVRGSREVLDSRSFRLNATETTETEQTNQHHERYLELSSPLSSEQ